MCHTCAAKSAMQTKVTCAMPALARSKRTSVTAYVKKDKVYGIEQMLSDNRKWAEEVSARDPTFFARNSQSQAPPYLWLGCSDSRVPANQIIGCEPGEVFVHRNVGNQVLHQDMNTMSAVEFSIGFLGVQHVVVCGHYNCGAVKGGLLFPTKNAGVTNLWISGIRECRNQHAWALRDLEEDAQVDRLCELNVVRQVFHVCTSYPVQQAWEAGKKLEVHGLIYQLENGLLRQLVKPITGFADLEAQKVKGAEVDTEALMNAFKEMDKTDAVGTVKVKAQKKTKQLAFLKLLASALQEDEEEQEKVLKELDTISDTHVSADDVVHVYLQNKLNEDLAWSQAKPESATNGASEAKKAEAKQSSQVESPKEPEKEPEKITATGTIINTSQKKPKSLFDMIRAPFQNKP